MILQWWKYTLNPLLKISHNAPSGQESLADHEYILFWSKYNSSRTACASRALLPDVALGCAHAVGGITGWNRCFQGTQTA